MDEMTIDLKDLVRRILLRWRVLVICMIIGCVLVTVFGGIQSFTAAQEAQAALEAQQLAGGPAEGQSWVVVPEVVWVNPMHIVLGLILGAAVVCVVVLVQYMMTPKLRVVGDMVQAFHVTHLGTIAMPRTYQKKFSKVDRWIDSIFRSENPNLPEDLQIRMICTDIKLTAQKAKMAKIYLTGSCDEEQLEGVKEKFCDKLQGMADEVFSGKSAVYAPESLEQLVAADGVVLFEKVDTSAYEDIKKELEFCERYQIPVIGCVVVE